MRTDSLREIVAQDFDLARTLDSGQVFHWERCGDGYAGTIGQNGAYVEQRRNRLFVTGTTTEVIRNYFALDHPLRQICRSFPNDPAMRAARDFCRGLRIIRQPRWECLATFITSSMKQVAHIRQISQTLRKRYGKRQRVFNFEVHSFPPAHRIAALTEQDLRACALGYRAKNLLATARLAGSSDIDLEQWTHLPDESLRARLCALPGVGAKVANCVMLFAYERLRAFPIDVWIERVLRQEYFPRKRKMTKTQLSAFVKPTSEGTAGTRSNICFIMREQAAPFPGWPRNDHRGAQVVRPGNVRYYPTNWRDPNCGPEYC